MIVIGLDMLLVALVLSLRDGATTALGLGVGLFALGIGVAIVGYGAIRRAPLTRTRARLSHDVDDLKEHVR